MWRKRTALIIVVVVALVALGLWQARDSIVQPPARIDPETNQAREPDTKPLMRIDPEASEDLTGTLTGKPPLNQ